MFFCFSSLISFQFSFLIAGDATTLISREDFTKKAFVVFNGKVRIDEMGKLYDESRIIEIMKLGKKYKSHDTFDPNKKVKMKCGTSNLEFCSNQDDSLKNETENSQSVNLNDKERWKILSGMLHKKLLLEYLSHNFKDYQLVTQNPQNSPFLIVNGSDCKNRFSFKEIKSEQLEKNNQKNDVVLVDNEIKLSEISTEVDSGIKLKKNAKVTDGTIRDRQYNLIFTKNVVKDHNHIPISERVDNSDENNINDNNCYYHNHNNDDNDNNNNSSNIHDNDYNNDDNDNSEINCNNIIPIRFPVRSSRRKSSLNSLSFDDKNESNSQLRKTKSAGSVSILAMKNSPIIKDEKEMKDEKAEEDGSDKNTTRHDIYDNKIDKIDSNTKMKFDNIKNNKLNLKTLSHKGNLNITYDTFQNIRQRDSTTNIDKKPQMKNKDYNNDNNSNRNNDHNSNRNNDNNSNRSNVNNNGKGHDSNKFHINDIKSSSHKYNNNSNPNNLNKRINYSKSYDGKNPETFFPTFFPTVEKPKLQKLNVATKSKFTDLVLSSSLNSLIIEKGEIQNNHLDFFNESENKVIKEMLQETPSIPNKFLLTKLRRNFDFSSFSPQIISSEIRILKLVTKNIKKFHLFYFILISLFL